jgi:hypothetical protein
MDRLTDDDIAPWARAGGFPQVEWHAVRASRFTASWNGRSHFGVADDLARSSLREAQCGAPPHAERVTQPYCFRGRGITLLNMWLRWVQRITRGIALLFGLMFLLIVGGMSWEIFNDGLNRDLALFLVPNLVCLAGVIATVKWPERGGWIILSGAALIMLGQLVTEHPDLAGVLPFVIMDLLLGAALIVTSQFTPRTTPASVHP